MTHDNDREQLAALRQRAEDATVEHRGIDTIAYLQERIRELRRENERLQMVARAWKQAAKRNRTRWLEFVDASTRFMDWVAQELDARR